MEAERLQQIEQLFHAALELRRDQRADFLRKVCRTDEPLHREVESLLAYGSIAENFIELPAIELEAQGMARDEVGRVQAVESDVSERNSGVSTARWLPTKIGHYRILSVLGEGGMGVVYEAEQEQPRRIVALKVVKPGLASPELLRRFEHESQALACLHHAGIAQIYEAGTADTGLGPQPYFAMELIHGPSLRNYAEEHGLNTRQRLELMVWICEAVQHAHQRGLIHRDLKPGNILVDETGQPKILDFGVARMTDSDVQTTRQTDLGQMVGTLAYMSPEQAFGDPLEVDTRSDVYALGVILYELLAGRLPYDLSRKPHEAARTIQDEDPRALSSINRLFRGDIETIVAKALEKDRARRYASASGLAADIQRFLKDEPIAARPPSASYQLRKFARRHRTLVAGVAAVFIALLGGVVASTLEAARARRAELAANTESARATAISDFLQNDLLAQAGASAQAGADTEPDPDLKVRTALDRAATRIAGKFDQQPLVEASIRQTIGDTYADLGLEPQAQPHIERALDIRRRVLGEKHRDTLISMSRLAEMYMNQGQYARAEPLQVTVTETRRRTLGDEHPDTLTAMDMLGKHYRLSGKYSQAEPLITKALQVRQQLLGDDHPDVLDSMDNLASLQQDRGEYEQAELLFTKALDARRRVLGQEHPDTLHSMNNLALHYEDEGKYEQAGPLFTKILEVRHRVLGDDHPDTLISMDNLALLYRYQGNYAQAESLSKKVVATEQRVLGPEHRDTLISVHNLAELYGTEGKYAQAESLLTKVVDISRRRLGDDHPFTLFAMNGVGMAYLKQQGYSKAEMWLRQVLSRYRKTDSWSRYFCQSMLGASLAGQRRFAEAEAPLVGGYEGMLQRESTIPFASKSKLEKGGEWIVQLYKNWGKPEKATEWQQKLKARS